MIGFNVEYKLEAIAENKARIHKRLVTPVCFFRLGHKDYSYEVFEGVMHFVPLGIVPVPVWVKGGGSSTHLCGRWKCAPLSGRVLDLLESHKKSFAKRLSKDWMTTNRQGRRSGDLNKL